MTNKKANVHIKATTATATFGDGHDHLRTMTPHVLTAIACAQAQYNDLADNPDTYQNSNKRDAQLNTEQEVNALCGLTPMQLLRSRCSLSSLRRCNTAPL